MLHVDLRAPQGAELSFAASFAVGPGTICALHGPSGAGKTTLLRAVAGLLPANGSLLFAGLDYRSLPPWQRPIGWVPQRQGLVPHWTPEEHLRALGPALSIEPRLALERLDLWRLGGRPVRQLSFGERQRLALGRALFGGRRLFLLDEPFSGLDAAARRSMGDLLLERVEALGACALIATHDLHDVQRLCDQLCLIADGRMLAQGPTHDLVRRPPNPQAAILLGYQILAGGLAVHPAQARWQADPDLVAVRAVVERARPKDFGWRIELRAQDGGRFAADLGSEGPLPTAGETVDVYFPDLRLT